MNGKIREKKISGYLSPEISVCFLVFYSSLSSGMNMVLSGMFGRTTNIILDILRIIGFSLLAFGLVCHRKRIHWDFIVLPIILSFLFLLAMINPDTSYEISRQGLISSVFIGAVPIYYSVRLSRRYDRIWAYLKIFAILSFSILFFAFFVANVGSKENYKTYSNDLFLCAAIFLIEWLYNNRRRYSIVAMASIFLIATCGRRSSLVSLILLIAIICVLRKKYKILVGGVLFGLFLMLFWSTILTGLYEFISGFGVRPRILLRIVLGNVTDDSHRFEQWAYVFEMIFSSIGNVFFGLGVVGERHYMLQHFTHMVFQGYPHGIHVELIAHFGLFIGVFLVLFFFVLGPVRFIKKYAQNSNQLPFFLLSFTLLTVLLLQDSYIQSRWFFMYLAMLIPLFKGVGKSRNVVKTIIERSVG